MVWLSGLALCVLCVCSVRVCLACLYVFKCVFVQACRSACVFRNKRVQINKQVTFAKSSGGGDQKLSQGTSVDRSRAYSGLTRKRKRRKDSFVCRIEGTMGSS